MQLNLNDPQDALKALEQLIDSSGAKFTISEYKALQMCFATLGANNIKQQIKEDNKQLKIKKNETI